MNKQYTIPWITLICLCRVRNEKIDRHRFSGMATQCVELLGTDIERIDIEAPSLSFLKKKIKR